MNYACKIHENPNVSPDCQFPQSGFTTTRFYHNEETDILTSMKTNQEERYNQEEIEPVKAGYDYFLSMGQILKSKGLT